MKMSHVPCFYLLLTGGVSGLCAQQPVPAADELTKLKARWQQMIAEKIQPLTASYDRALVAEQQKLQAAGNYEAADTIHEERVRLGTARREASDRKPAVAEADVLVSPSAPVELNLQKATLSEGLEWDENTLTITGWKAQSTARWALPASLPHGGYEVEILCACPADGGGRITLRESFYSMERDVVPSAGWEDYTLRKLGTLRISGRTSFLEIAALAVKDSGLMRLRSIRLIPVSSEP